MKKRLSIHDIARDLNVSAATISFVINGKATEKGISEALTQKITAYINHIGYKPNMVAQSLRTGKSKIIGMLVENIADHFFAHIARGVEKRASLHGYKLFFSSTENDPGKAKALLKLFRDSQVEGYIIASPPGLEKEIRELTEDGIPLILFDRYFPEIDTNNIVIDNFGSVYKALAHLRRNLFLHTGFITLASEQLQMKARLDGYLQATKESGQQQTLLKLPYNCAARTVIEEIKKFLSSHRELDAILFATNYLTDFGIEAIKELGWHIPHDLAVISFDDNHHFKLLSPTITAVAQPLETIAEQVVTKLISSLNNQNTQEKTATIMLPAELIIRDSTKPLPA